MSFTRRLFGTALAATAAMAMALPAAAQSAQDLVNESILTTIQEEGVIRIGLSVFTPWSMRDVNGDLIGFELDVGRQLAEDLGVEVEFVPTSWDGIIPALIAGNFDVIISGMSWTPQRNLTVAFSDPYAYSGMAIYSNIEMTEGLTIDDYNSPDITFAARRGATPAVVIQNRFPDAELLLFDEDGAATQEVLNGNAHATVSSQPTPDREVARYPDTLHVPFDVLLDPSGEAFAMRQGDPVAMNFFNNWIAARLRSGWLEERHDYWFVGSEWEDQVPAE
ncbi:transporter substrate-binding domain-containing protein [Rhodophyticola sp. CCM32]|uniref:transporter substrate-binding domain-containing protein n=1 Tax=Rhodophyticola sp. CCM32 TaxID=2916397 RepID=UPI00107F791F|nr:transporter substrate-binding domain-containing protein [Rhodophyticola sp. CCM32]QBY01372.1 transporter substrate-binding domain-containing protein [Rhodophyticola sp. CCM32]